MSRARLRAVPTIAFEPEEGGARLRRGAGEPRLEQVQGAASGSPHQRADPGRPRWSAEVRDVQMRTKVASTMVEEVFRNVRAMADLLQTNLLDDVGLEELAYQIHEIQKAADLLQPA